MLPVYPASARSAYPSADGLLAGGHQTKKRNAYQKNNKGLRIFGAPCRVIQYPIIV